MEHKVVSHGEWVAARQQHLADEKEFTKARDRLSSQRRELPWEVVDKEYTFEGAGGRRSLGQLFDGRGQLVIYHAMFNPNTASESTTWTKDSACFACSFWMDNFNDVVVHLNHRDVTMAAAAIAPYARFAAYRDRMGWSFPVYSSAESDFNFDYHVSFTAEQMEAGKAEDKYRVDPRTGRRRRCSWRPLAWRFGWFWAPESTTRRWRSPCRGPAAPAWRSRSPLPGSMPSRR